MRIKVNRDRTLVAVETGPKVMAGPWFYFDWNNGGFYTDGEREGIDYWEELEVPDPAPRPDEQAAATDEAPPAEEVEEADSGTPRQKAAKK